MVETLTESFCERCGTRYEFKAPTRLNPLRKTRGFIGGLKNYLTSQDDLSDALGDAMRSEEDALAAAQLEAFHESFNFCIDCRQYTCLKCWNDDAGRCRSCAPVPGKDDLAERLAASLAASAVAAPVEPAPAAEEIAPDIGPEAWPTRDLPVEPVASVHVADPWPTAPPAAEPAPVGGFVGADGFVYESREQADAVAQQAEEELEWTPAAEAAEEAPAIAAEYEYQSEPAFAEAREPEPVAAEVFEPEPLDAEEPEPELVVAEAPETQPEIEPVAADVEAEPAGAETLERPALRVVAWDEDGEYDLEPEPVAAEEVIEIAASVDVEAEPAAATAAEAPEAEPELVAVEPEPVLAVEELEPVVAEVEPEPEPVAADADIEPVTASEVEAWPEPAAEPEPVAAEPAAASAEPQREEPEPEPVHRIGPIADTILRFPRRAPTPPTPAERVAALDESAEQAARREQLDLLGLGDEGQAPLPPDRPAVVPYRSRGAAVPQGELAARARAQGSTFWEASAREVAGASANIGVQNCGQCGLSLSANARFCRRCGTRQAQSA